MTASYLLYGQWPDALNTRMTERNLPTAAIAEICGVDPSSVRRWRFSNNIPWHHLPAVVLASGLPFDLFIAPDLLRDRADAGTGPVARPQRLPRAKSRHQKSPPETMAAPAPAPSAAAENVPDDVDGRPTVLIDATQDVIADPVPVPTPLSVTAASRFLDPAIRQAMASSIAGLRRRSIGPMAVIRLLSRVDRRSPDAVHALVDVEPHGIDTTNPDLSGIDTPNPDLSGVDAPDAQAPGVDAPIAPPRPPPESVPAPTGYTIGRKLLDDYDHSTAATWNQGRHGTAESPADPVIDRRIQQDSPSTARRTESDTAEHELATLLAPLQSPTEGAPAVESTPHAPAETAHDVILELERLQAQFVRRSTPALVVGPAMTCQYIMDGDTRSRLGQSPHFCGKPSIHGKSYCLEHAEKCFVRLAR